MKTPKLKTNPAAGLIADSLEHENISAAAASRAMQIPRSRLSDIFAGRKGVSADTALRLERYLGISSALLVRLQADYDLSQAVQSKSQTIRAEVRPLTATV
jgi:addiction module HigA family antidote